jgi:tetratricopeptide (TPR) repeat protein
MTAAAELYHRLAEEAFRAGQPDVAGVLLRLSTRNTTGTTEQATEWHRQAVQLLNQGKPRDAEVMLLQSIELQPNNAAWHEHLGIALAQQQRFAEAANTLRVALRLNPSASLVWNNLARCYFDLGNFVAAEAASAEARKLTPFSVEIHVQHLRSLKALEQFDRAAELAEEFAKQHPGNAEAANAAGLCLAELKNFDEAIAYFTAVQQLQPNSAEAASNLAAALGKAKHWEACEVAARRAIELQPDHPGAWGNLGNSLRDQGKYDDAIPALERALRLNPKDADAAGNLALTLATQGHHERALQWYDSCLAMKPDYGEMRFNRSLTYLTLDDPRGWPEYEARWLTEAMKASEPKLPIPKWDGTPKPGKTIFIVNEQGLGDTIQFSRYANDLQRRGFKVVLRPPLELIELFQHSFPNCMVVNDTETTAHTYAAMMSLPGLLNQRIGDVDGSSYLTAPSNSVAKWKERLADDRNLRVGLVWQGNPKHGGDRWRSIPLAKFATLASVKGVSLYSVQKGHVHEQLATCGFPIIDLGSELTNFADTAGLLKSLDLLISVDSAVVHLAGSLAVPTWNLISFNNDWRWLKGRTDTPWYRSMRLFRQPKLQDWDAVLAEVLIELRRTASMNENNSRS